MDIVHIQNGGKRKMYEKNTLMERIMEILERLDVRELRLVYFFAEGLRKGANR